MQIFLLISNVMRRPSKLNVSKVGVSLVRISRTDYYKTAPSTPPDQGLPMLLNREPRAAAPDGVPIAGRRVALAITWRGLNRLPAR